MKIIWKFPLKMLFAQEIEMPAGARVLCVQVQGEIPCIWAEIDSTIAGPTNRRVHIQPTGRDFDENMVGEYLGTFQLESGDLILHVFVEHEKAS